MVGLFAAGVMNDVDQRVIDFGAVEGRPVHHVVHAVFVEQVRGVVAKAVVEQGEFSGVAGVGSQFEHAAGPAYGVARCFGIIVGRHEDAGGTLREQTLEFGSIQNPVPVAIVREINPVSIGRVARRMLEHVDESAALLWRPVGGNPIADRFQAVLFEYSVGVFAKTLDQVFEAILVRLVDAQFVHGALGESWLGSGFGPWRVGVAAGRHAESHFQRGAENPCHVV